MIVADTGAILALIDRDDEHQAWKSKVLAQEIEVPEVDLTPFRMRTNQTPTKAPRSA